MITVENRDHPSSVSSRHHYHLLTQISLIISTQSNCYSLKFIITNASENLSFSIEMIGFIQNSKLRDDIHSLETSLTSGVLLERYQLHQVPSLLTLTGLTNPPHIMIMQKLFPAIESYNITAQQVNQHWQYVRSRMNETLKDFHDDKAWVSKLGDQTKQKVKNLA